ncbi:MAG: hypothetical protein JST54_25935 [Deltaproteobacteria bacterium]|nr:hypothetical protein [Deltaproteobacteria bacterium]
MSTVAFFASGDADPSYENIRDSDLFTDVKARIEELWPRFAAVCGDPQAKFLSEARTTFNARVWEMYLACVLMDHGLQLTKPPSNGPDVLADTAGGRRLWVEAVAPGTGKGDNKVQRIVGQVGKSRGGGTWQQYNLDHDKHMLRYLKALEDKLGQLRERLAAGVVQPDDCYVVAISGANLPDADLNQEVPYIVKALLGIGDAVMTVPIGSEGVDVDVSHPPRSAIKQSERREVVAGPFWTDEYKLISGVLFSPYDIANTPAHMGDDDLLFVHNPMATSPLPHGTMTFGREVWSEAGSEHYVLVGNNFRTVKGKRPNFFRAAG